MDEAKLPTPCGSCPWRKANHGKPHADGWYKTGNLRRLWNGLRSGNAPGMICHATDPKAITYGGDKAIAPGHERPCAGALLLVRRSLDHFSKACDQVGKDAKRGAAFKLYREGVGARMTLTGLGAWVSAIAFYIHKPGTMHAYPEPSRDTEGAIGVPWDDDVLNCADIPRAQEGSST